MAASSTDALRHGFRNGRFAALALAAVLMAASARADIIYPVSATANSSFSGFPAFDAIDQGANGFNTDWAANGTGAAGSFLDLDLGAIFSLTTAFVTDRVTSGASNGVPLKGSRDFTTSFELQVADSSFHAIGPAFEVDNLQPPPTGVPVQVGMGAIDARYLIYTVLAADGVNPGLADIHFDARPVPAPIVGAGLPGLIMAAGGLLAWRRRKRGTEVAA